MYEFSGPPARRLLSVAALLCTLASCVSSEAGAQSQVFGAFVGDHVLEAGQPKNLVEGTELQLIVERHDGAVRARWGAGCNETTVPTDIAADRLHPDAGQLMATTMGCGARLSEQEEWFDDFMLGGPRWEREGQTLRLIAADGTSTIELQLQGS
jgi:heat shock protein HslJ